MLQCKPSARAAKSFAGLFFLASLCHAAPPAVKVEYGPDQDRWCSMLPGNTIKDEWKAELSSRKAEFVQLWEKAGPPLMQATESITGKSFPAGEIRADLTLCNSPSESAPQSGRVTVNMRFALASFAKSPVSLRYKANTLFHELLHIFMFHHPVHSSKLLEKHAAEPERVRTHLHLLALQKAALLRLGDMDGLKEVIAVDSALPGGFYKRAWELVDMEDNRYLEYVAELTRPSAR